jgi:hypothetical protein
VLAVLLSRFTSRVGVAQPWNIRPQGLFKR